jgi:hypothetical protein
MSFKVLHKISITRYNPDNSKRSFPARWHIPNLPLWVPSGKIIFRTKSPTWNDFSMTCLLYALAIFSFSLSISSNALNQLSWTSSILSIMSSWYSLEDKLSCPVILKICKPISTGNSTSWPYTSSKGVTVVAQCLDVLCAHNTSDNFSCHLLGLSSILFSMILINTLLLALAWH